MTMRSGTPFGIVGVAAALAAALLLPIHGASAQQADLDARWLPWLGCWTEMGTPGEVLCVRPASDARGVELVTVRDGDVAGTERLRADGVVRKTRREGCAGTERAGFSTDGRRIHLHSDLVCEGGVDREGTGLIAMVSPTEWIRVEAVEVAGEIATVTERFREAPDTTAREAGVEGVEEITAGREMAVRAARRAAASRPSVDELVEASERMEAEAVRTWVAELDRPLDVDASKLARLADAGVPDEVIDVVVAVSFPEEFALDRDARGRDTPAAGPAYRGRFGTGFYGYRHPFYRDPFYFGFSPFGYGFRRHGWWYGSNRPTVVVVTPRDDDGASSGRVVNGRGYTQGPPDPAGERTSVGTGSASRGSGSITPRGARSGGSGSTGRKAKPRDSSSDGGDGGSDGGA